MNSGVYCITCSSNKHKYIGSTSDLERRKVVHFRDLRLRSHPNYHLQNAFLKYGKNNFVFEVLEYCESNDLIRREQYWIDKLKPEYNISPTAGSNRGSKLSNKTKLKMSLAQKGKKKGPFSNKHKTNISKALIGRPGVNIGRKLSNEWKRKISNSLKGRVGPNKNKKLSIQWKNKISNALKGRTFSQEHLNKIKDAKRRNHGNR